MHRIVRPPSPKLEEFPMTVHTPLPAAPTGYFEDLANKALVPGWAKKEPAMWPTPRSKYVPAVWRYSDARAALDTAGTFVSPEQAERRNLILVDPIPGNIYPTCRHLVAAYQLVLPGETAHAHRHSPNALRIILDAGPNTYTVVNGTKVELVPNDIVLTPTWNWHDHSNLGDTTAFWIDILDVPLVQNLENIYFQEHPEVDQSVNITDPNSTLRLKGADVTSATKQQGVVNLDVDSISTMAVRSLGVSKGQEIRHPKRIINNIYAVLSGQVRFEVENLGEVKLTRGDIVVVPCWHEYVLSGLDDWSQIIQVSDEPVFRKLGFSDLRREQF